jgi:hypothetical protein
MHERQIQEKQKKEKQLEEKYNNEYLILSKKKLAYTLHSNRERLRAENRWVGGKVPFGYRAYRGMLLIHKREKEALQKILELTLEGHSVYRIWGILKQQGYLSKLGKPISRNTVYRVTEESRIDVYLGGRYETPIAKPHEDLYSLLLKFV